jgi:hypothetical protein
MTLDDLLLAKLAEWRPDKGRQTLIASDAASGWRAALTADGCDTVGCRVWEMDLARDRAAADLRGWAERLAARATGLLEPLKLLELDAERGMAQLRSGTPSQRGGVVSYYEITLRGKGEASVRRFQATRDGKPREQIAFALTHEVLAKLAGDVAASA